MASQMGTPEQKFHGDGERRGLGAERHGLLGAGLAEWIARVNEWKTGAKLADALNPIQAPPLSGTIWRLP